MSPSLWFRCVSLCALLVAVAASLFARPPAGKGDALRGGMTGEEVAEAKGKDSFENSLGMKLVRVKPGKFMMGSPKDEKDRDDDELQHEVEITKDYFIGVTEVTQKQYKAIMGYNPSFFSTNGTKSDQGEYEYGSPAGGKDRVKGKVTDEFPVELVSWEDARVFLTKLNALPAEKKVKVKYRLPTEAEWEYACRGGHRVKDKDKAQLPFHFKTASASLGMGQANFDARYPYGDGKKANAGIDRTSVVGKNGEANALGLHDVHGNVWEWCADWYGEDYYKTSPAKDPQGASEKKDGRRMKRGGSWIHVGKHCRSAIRSVGKPEARFVVTGFRVAAVPHK